MKEKRGNGVLTALACGGGGTKLSAIVMGSGQFAKKQYTKGAIYFLIEVLYVLFIVFVGGRLLMQLFSGDLGTKLSGEIWNDKLQLYEKIRGDNSFLILLYGVATLLLSGLFFLVWRMQIMQSYEGDKLLKNGERLPNFIEECKGMLQQKFHITLLTLPFIGLMIFTLLPLVFMILIAFTSYDYNHMPPGKLFDWVGFTNFKKLFLFTEGNGFAIAFLRVITWTFVWAFFATFSNYFLGMLLALAINKKGIKWKKVWRTMFVVSIAVPQFVTLLLMQKILDRSGILNVVLGKNILWLTDTRWGSLIPRIMIILVNIWIGVPYTLLLTSGLLMNIPADIYEAASLDGASPRQMFFKITLPYMLHMTTPYLITQFVGNINNFNVIWLLTGGGPINSVLYGNTQAQSTDLLVTWLYRLTTDSNPQYNVASVIGIVIFVISAVLSIITFQRSSANRQEEAFQ